MVIRNIVNLFTYFSSWQFFLPESAQSALNGMVSQASSVTGVGPVSGMANQSTQGH